MIELRVESMMPPMEAGTEAELIVQVRAISNGGDVQRFHTMRTIKPNTVGQHSYGVAMLCQLLMPDCSKTLLLAALTHDMAEQWTGDVPAPAKIAMGLSGALHQLEERSLKNIGFGYGSQLTDDEAAVLKLADMLDGLSFCIREYNLGNTDIIHALRNFKHWAGKAVWTPRHTEVYNTICNEVHKPV